MNLCTWDTALRWSPVIHCIILIAGTLTSFLLAYFNGHVSIYVPFISETGANVPEMCIFSLCLIFGSFIGAIVIYFRYCIVTFILSANDKRNRIINIIACFIGLISMAGLSGVAAFPVSTVFWAHMCAAGIHFAFGLAYIFIQSYLSYYVPGCSKLLKRLRVALSLSVGTFLVLLVILFPIGFSGWMKQNQKPPAIKTPNDFGFGLIVASALLEWLMYLAFMLFILTFLAEFLCYGLSVSLVHAESLPIPTFSQYVFSPTSNDVTTSNSNKPLNKDQYSCENETIQHNPVTSKTVD